MIELFLEQIMSSIYVRNVLSIYQSMTRENSLIIRTPTKEIYSPIFLSAAI